MKMRKPNFKIFVCILFFSGCSQKIAEQHGEESKLDYAENIAEQDDNIKHSDYPDSPVSKCA